MIVELVKLADKLLDEHKNKKQKTKIEHLEQEVKFWKRLYERLC